MIKLFDFVLSRSLTFENKELKKMKTTYLTNVDLGVCLYVCVWGGGGGMVGT